MNIRHAIAAVAIVAFATPLHAESLVIATSDFAGFPVEDVRFTVHGEGLDDGERSTDENGRLIVELPNGDAVVTIELADDRYRTDRTMLRSDAEARLLPVRLFAADATAMEEAERIEFAYFYPRLFTAEAARVAAARDEAEDETAPEPTALAESDAFRLSAFLAGMRRESPAPFVLPDPASDEDFDPENNEAPPPRPVRASIRVIDDRGRGVQGVRVDLFAYDKESATVRLVGWERTSPRGVASFTDVVEGAVHRAEARLADGRVARSTFRRVQEEDQTTFPVMIARPVEAQISGVVVADGNAAEGVLLELLRPDGRTLVSETSDAEGFFSLGPLAGDGYALRLTSQQAGDSRTFELPVEMPWREMLLPVDVLFAE